MKEIYLTRGYTALVDEDDYQRMMCFNWHTAVTKNTCYAARYIRINGKDSQAYMHREILGLKDSKIHVDHIDHNGLNNTRSNLRLSNRLLNNRNRRSRVGSTSKYVGVCWSKKSKKWQAQIDIDGIQTDLGSFDLEIDAATARDAAAIKHYGEIAFLNLP